MALTRRELLTAIAAAGVGGAPRRTAAQAGRSDALPWASLRRQLQASYHDLRRHFVFEYYPWYANTPFRHWQQWGRVPPADLAGTSMPLLGAYDSRSVAVIEQHARWIADAGVGVVDLSWWGVGSFSDAAVSVVMDVMRAHDIEVTFHLEPYRADRVEHLAADVQYLAPGVRREASLGRVLPKPPGRRTPGAGIQAVRHHPAVTPDRLPRSSPEASGIRRRRPVAVVDRPGAARAGQHLPRCPPPIGRD